MTANVAFTDLTTCGMSVKAEDRQRVAPSSPWAGTSSVLDLNDWQVAALKGVYKVGALPSNWDDEGGEPPSKRVVTFAEALIRSMPFIDLPSPFVAPTPRGGIQFEWEEGLRELDIEILPDCSLEYLKVEAGQPGDEGTVNISQLQGLFKWLRHEPERETGEGPLGLQSRILRFFLLKNFPWSPKR